MNDKRERPILMSGPMVRAILEGRKTMTRRVVKFPPHTYTPDLSWIASVNPDGKDGWIAWGPKPVTDDFSRLAYPDGGGFLCPYGRPGDRLWVRETWHYAGGNNIEPSPGFVSYRADGEFIEYYQQQGYKWKPSIFMPRWASRLALEITAVGVERLQDISEEDARAEGADRPFSVNRPWGTYRAGFAYLWDRINGKRPGCSWESNPWVWPISFKRVMP